MIEVLEVNKQGNKIISYTCDDGSTDKVKYLSKEELIHEIENNNVSNARLQVYKGKLIVRVHKDSLSSAKLNRLLNKQDSKEKEQATASASTSSGEYKLNIRLTSPDLVNTKDRKLAVKVVRSNSGYGNDSYLAIKGIDNSFEQFIDMRYDTSFNPNKPEPSIVAWAYSYWTGENGSWRIIKLSIQR